MLLEKIVKIREVSEFSLLTYDQNQKFLSLESVFLLQILRVVATEEAKTTKN